MSQSDRAASKELPATSEPDASTTTYWNSGTPKASLDGGTTRSRAAPASCAAAAAHDCGRRSRSGYQPGPTRRVPLITPAVPTGRWQRGVTLGSRGCANPCGAGRQVLAQFISAGAVCCGRNAGPQWLTPCMPRPRRAAGTSASSRIGTSMIARILVPGAPVAHALFGARRPCTGCACRLSQSHSGDDGAWSFSSPGISSSLVSFVNIANIDLRGSQA